MKIEKQLSLRLIGFLIAMPLIAWLTNYILYDERIYRQWTVWLFSFPLICFLGYIGWVVQMWCLAKVQHRFPSLKQTTTRVLIVTALTCLIVFLFFLIIFGTYHFFNILGYQYSRDDARLAFILGMSVNLIFITLTEVFYSIEKYKENLAEKELLEHMNVMQEFENLKSQVNPHFLFNCFNTLSSLMFENKAEAEVFLDELSQVYRYLLRTNVGGVATLANEIKFITSYYKLLKTRH